MTPNQKTVQGASTAIKRARPSGPARSLAEQSLLRGRCLDYGCGRGKDADTFNMERFDPHWAPQPPTGKFDTILCTYVLNVVPPQDVPNILRTIQDLLAPGGRAYLTVRRDLGGQDKKGRGTTQRHVELDLPVLQKRQGYCTYELRRPA
jgi:ATP adenylyltransferase